MSCDEGEVTESLENELYVTTHSATLPLLHLPSQLILQPFFCLSYITGFSLTSPGEPPMAVLLNLTLTSKKCGMHLRPHGRSENFYGDRNCFKVIYICYMNDTIIIIIIIIIMAAGLGFDPRRGSKF